MTEPKKASHQANVICITPEMLRAHPDPETTSLELIDIGGYQVVVRKDQFKPGDLAVYIQPDSVVPQTEPFRFLWEGQVGVDGIVPEKRRRVTVRKFRKEWSEGLLLPLADFDHLQIGPHGEVYQYFPEEGEDISDRLGITHYDPDAGTESIKGNQAHTPKRKFRYPRTFRGWIDFIGRFFRSRGRITELTVDVPVHIPVYDVDALKNYKGTFIPGELVVVTEKIHGSNARFLYLDGTQYAGSRNQWKAKGDSIWWKAISYNPWIESWCKTHPGYVLWGEVTPSQKGFTYGCKNGDVMFFAFDVYTPNGSWLTFDQLWVSDDFMVETHVPLLYKGPYDEEKILKLVDGPSMVANAGHIREGIVIKTAVERSVRGLGRVQLKVVSSDFYAKDSK